MNDNVLFALGLTLLAGLSTGIGSLIAFFAKKTNTKLLSMALGFSAGIMIYISMVELFYESRDLLISVLGKTSGPWITVAAFLGGIVFIGVIDRLVPKVENPHEPLKVEDMDTCEYLKEDLTKDNTLMRAGLLTAIAIAIHNFPEGLATLASSLRDPSLGIATALAVAIHNIPEGISVSVPIYCATGSKKKAFRFSFLSGLSEPLGAIIGYLILMPFLNDAVFGILLGFIAGIMIFISLDELLPLARKYDEAHLSMYGLVLGMAVMAVSLLMIG